MAEFDLKTHGITESTPKNLLFSAGTFYKNLKYTATKWEGTVLGATSGGGKVTITPEYADAELDGATVAVKGAKFKVGETASLEATFTEIKEGITVDALHLVKDSTFSNEKWVKYDSKALLDDSDFLENVAFVGTLTSGKQVIFIMDNAICTSAFELNGQNKTQATYTCTFECTADLTQGDLYHLPYHIYFPVSEA